MTDEQLRTILTEELTKVAGQIFQRFDALEAKVDLKADADRIYKSLDGIAKRLDDDEAERAAMTAQIDRHERWHHQAADKLGLKLEY